MRIEVILRILGVWDMVNLVLDYVKKKNIMKLLFQSMPEDNNKVKVSKIQTLITELENMKMSDTITIDDFATKLLGIASKFSSLGEAMVEHKHVKNFLMSLLMRFFTL